jgi:hypothetical protein
VHHRNQIFCPVSLSLGVKKQRLAHNKKSIYGVADLNCVISPRKSIYGVADVNCAANQPADPNGTLSDHILNAVLALLRKEVSEHGRHLQQYFHLFLMYLNLGTPEVRGSLKRED